MVFERFLSSLRRCIHYTQKMCAFGDLTDPEPVPRGSEYASVIESNVAIVVQHTRLDSRRAANALISTIAFANTEPLM